MLSISYHRTTSGNYALKLTLYQKYNLSDAVEDTTLLKSCLLIYCKRYLTIDDIGKAYSVFNINSDHSAESGAFIKCNHIDECLKMLGKNMSNLLLEKWLELAGIDNQFGASEFMFLACNFKKKEAINHQKIHLNKILLPEQEIKEPVNQFRNSFYIQKPHENIQKELNRSITQTTKIILNYKKQKNRALFSKSGIENLKISPKKDGKTIFVEDMLKLHSILRKDALYKEMKTSLHCSDKKLSFLRDRLRYSKKTMQVDLCDESLLLSGVKAHPYFSAIESKLKEQYRNYFMTPSKIHQSYF